MSVTGTVTTSSAMSVPICPVASAEVALLTSVLPMIPPPKRWLASTLARGGSARARALPWSGRRALALHHGWEEGWAARMRSDITPGGTFPDYELPDQDSAARRLSELQGDDP